MLTTNHIYRLHQSFALAAIFCVLTFRSSAAGAQSGTTANLPTSSASTAIYGKVINAVTNSPVPRALVQINDRAFLTDHEGSFQFSGIDTGAGLPSSVNLRVTKPGYYASPDGETTLSTTVSSAQIATSLTIRLYPEAVVMGVLTAEDGTPLPRVLVTAQRSVDAETGHQWSPVSQRQSNSRGEYRLAVPPGEYRLETGFVPDIEGRGKNVIPSVYPSTTSSDASNLIHLGSGTEQRIDLHPGVSEVYPVSLHIEQRVEQNFGPGIPMIMARSSNGAVIPVNYVRSSSEEGGQVQLPLGTYTLIANQYLGQISEYGETSVTVTGAKTPPAVLRMSSLPAISVEVIVDSASTSDKTPPSAQQLGLILNPTGGSTRGGSIGIAGSRDRSSFVRAVPGSYRLASAASGSWFVSSATYGGTDLLLQDLVIAAGSESSSIRLTVSDQTGSLAGTAKLNGTPAALWVYLIPSGPSANPIYTVRSSAAGTFNFAFLPPGSYRALAFELRHQDDYRVPERLTRFSTWIRSVAITSGNKASLDLDAVPAPEMPQ